MKKLTYFVGFIGLFSFISCLSDQCESTRTFVQMDPVFVPESEIRPGIGVSESRALQNPGNIYVYRHYLLINELREGVHVIDNSDPAAPQRIGFIEIPGNLNMAVRADILYADLYLDIVAIDISDPMNASIISREDGVFASYYPLEEAGYIVEWRPSERTMDIDCDDEGWGGQWFWRAQNDLFVSVDVLASSAGGSAEVVTGVGGSMARFAIAKDHLYALDDYRMRVFNIDDHQPNLVNTVEVDWGIETLFPYEDYLFIGANAGMFILDNHEPARPFLLTEFVHAQSCDPVFVSNDIAYVTLRDGNTCRGFVNQLEVIDVSDMAHPDHLRTYQMDNPHGLSVAVETLFLCEGDFGLKVYSVEDPERINAMLDRIRGLHAVDVIALDHGNHLIVVGRDGVFQFDASDKSNLEELSFIEIQGT